MAGRDHFKVMYNKQTNFALFQTWKCKLNHFFFMSCFISCWRNSFAKMYVPYTMPLLKHAIEKCESDLCDIEHSFFLDSTIRRHGSSLR